MIVAIQISRSKEFIKLRQRYVYRICTTIPYLRSGYGTVSVLFGRQDYTDVTV